jgi:hypothetical protein
VKEGGDNNAGTSPRAKKGKKKVAEAEAPSITYKLEHTDPEELYKTTTTDLEKLPLELFDTDETDRSPQEWVQLGVTDYNDRGTPARALFFHNREWKWYVHATFDIFTELCVLYTQAHTRVCTYIHTFTQEHTRTQTHMYACSHASQVSLPCSGL